MKEINGEKVQDRGLELSVVWNSEAKKQWHLFHKIFTADLPQNGS